MTRSAPPKPFQHSKQTRLFDANRRGSPPEMRGGGGLNVGIQRPSVGGFGQSPRFYFNS
ncbi:hypothetical protein BSSX_p20025 (plasmid) [Bacillus subtilis]|nr:hypothetical protein BSSX_p20025 [Bacillus subtilis]